MVNYADGKIYKIIDNTNGNIYIGSTAEPTLARRLAKHRSNYNRYLNGQCHYVTSYDILENGDYSIILIEKYSCDSKDQLKARERFHIEGNKCVNKYIPGRTNKEYRMDNKERIIEVSKEYRIKNKERISQAKKEYYVNNKERIIEAVKEYSIDNKERIKERHKTYYNNTSQEECICDVCGSVYKIWGSSQSRHEKTIKHQNAMHSQD
ncbi:MAG: hypothetical protein EOO43_16805 [Flavobacterium sp.]|nr:MAG: hypothetical protein EOO43_16805 [Flavobacterium sp.]